MVNGFRVRSLGAIGPAAVEVAQRFLVSEIRVGANSKILEEYLGR